MLSIKDCLVATALVGLATYFTRALPFVLFKTGLPRPLERVVRYLPPMLMAILLVYCFGDIKAFISLEALVYLACTLFAIVLEVVFRSAMVSIFVPTAVYMALVRILGIGL